ncbi:hypothetical protein Aperf_G00000057022 [Anoplocephala perfoliata]
MAPPSCRFQSIRRRSRSPLGLSSRSYRVDRSPPRHFRHNGGPSGPRPRFREQPLINASRDFAPRRNSLIQDERRPSPSGSWIPRNRGPVGRSVFDNSERCPSADIVPNPKRYHRSAPSVPLVGVPHLNRSSAVPRDDNRGRGNYGGRRRENPSDRNRRFLDNGNQPYRSERPRHHHEGPPIRESSRGVRSYERDHWRSEPHQSRRNVPPLPSPPPRPRPRFADTAYERPYVDDVRRPFRGGVARGGGGRSFRFGRGAMRPPPNRSVPLHRPSRH